MREMKEVLNKNKEKQKISDLFKNSTRPVKYEAQDNIQEESKESEQIDTSSKSQNQVFSEIAFNPIASKEDLLSITDAVENIISRPELGIFYGTKFYGDNKKDQIQDFIDNIIPNFISALGSNAASRAQMLKVLYENGKTEFCRLITEHREDKFDLAQNTMHPSKYNQKPINILSTAISKKNTNITKMFFSSRFSLSPLLFYRI